ncbi:MAG: hypothetical protein AB7H96_13165 [Vicinamibacterales bacterium]
MQLRHARLCLNCEEIHNAAHCPVCTSESFTYVSRWVPPGERRSVARPRAGRSTGPSGSPSTPAGPAETSRPGRRWARRGAAGLAIVAASRLLWQLSRPVEWTTGAPPAGADEEPDRIDDGASNDLESEE